MVLASSFIAPVGRVPDCYVSAKVGRGGGGGKEGVKVLHKYEPAAGIKKVKYKMHVETQDICGTYTQRDV